jgi:hypothetical protein
MHTRSNTNECSGGIGERSDRVLLKTRWSNALNITKEFILSGAATYIFRNHCVLPMQHRHTYTHIKSHTLTHMTSKLGRRHRQRQTTWQAHVSSVDDSQTRRSLDELNTELSTEGRRWYTGAKSRVAGQIETTGRPGRQRLRSGIRPDRFTRLDRTHSSEIFMEYCMLHYIAEEIGTKALFTGVDALQRGQPAHHASWSPLLADDGERHGELAGGRVPLGASVLVPHGVRQVQHQLPARHTRPPVRWRVSDGNGMAHARTERTTGAAVCAS